MAEIIQRIDKNNAEAPEMRRRIWAIVGASSGNLVEWFDFYVYSFCSLYFAHIFFPSGNTLLSFCKRQASLPPVF